MNTIKKSFTHKGQTINLSGAENCSIVNMVSKTNQFYEKDFLEALDGIIAKDKWVVDIGAHIGNHTIYWSKILNYKVLALEPNADTYRYLKENIQANGVSSLVSALNVAASDTPGSVTLTPLASQDPGTYSILRTPGEGSFQCKAVIIDDYMEYFQTRVPGLIKIDVEGAEAKILKGALQTLQTFWPLITTEITQTDAFNTIGDILSPIGYFPIGIYNATPTVVWSAIPTRDAATSNPYLELMQVTRYGIDAALSSNTAQIKVRELKEETIQLKVSQALAKKNIVSKVLPKQAPLASPDTPDKDEAPTTKTPDVKAPVASLPIKKPAAQTASVKAAPKKLAAKKLAAKAATASKPSAKRPVAKTVTAKKPAAKETAIKKSTTKKTTAKKTTAKKPITNPKTGST